MLAQAPARMDADAFLEWVQGRPKGERYELCEGEVVAMAAERAAHVDAKLAATPALRTAIDAAGLPCKAYIDGLAVRIDPDTVYEPDALVRCGEPLDPDTVTITDPLLVVEVTSPSSSRIDVDGKLADYFRLPSVRHYLIVKLKGRTLIHHRREAGGLITTRIVTAGAVRLDPPGLELPVEAFFPA